MGRTLCKSYLDKEKFVRTNILMEAPNAVTMSKTKGNSINLVDSPEDMYGKAMSYSDDLIVKGLTLLTDVPLEEVMEYEKQMKAGENPMEFKKILAYEIVNVIKGEKAAKKAQQTFEKTVQKGEAPEDMIEITIEDSLRVLDIAKNLVEKSEADFSSGKIKRIIKQGGFSINDKKITNPGKEVKVESDSIIKLGKRLFGKIK
jgi:tyrosyl-tRNA synthetase